MALNLVNLAALISKRTGTPVDAHIRTCDRCAGSTSALETSLCVKCRRELGWEPDEQRIQELADEAEQGYDLSRLRPTDVADRVHKGIGLGPGDEKSPREDSGDPRQSPESNG